MNGVPGITLRPSGPDLSLFAPAHVGPVLHPANPPVICATNVLVGRSMTSTDLLLRSVKYMRPVAVSTPLMSKEKLVPADTPGTATTDLRSGNVCDVPCPPPQADRTMAARHGRPNISIFFMSLSPPF